MAVVANGRAVGAAIVREQPLDRDTLRGVPRDAGGDALHPHLSPKRGEK